MSLLQVFSVMYTIKALKRDTECVILHAVGPWFFLLTWFTVIEAPHMDNRVLSAAAVNSGLQSNSP